MQNAISEVVPAGRLIIQDSERAGRALDDVALTARQLRDLAASLTSLGGQSNLLALNAASEATRAGDAGRGAALITSELQELARTILRLAESIGERSEIIETAVDEAAARMSTIRDRSRVLVEKFGSAKVEASGGCR